jgi:putative RNA 2'-phosphotransferase
MSDDKRLSKFLSLVLRHRPDEFDITLDTNGFTDVDALFAVVQSKYKNRYSYEDFVRVTTTPAQDGKMRFELIDGRIRARYGHNKRVESIEYQSVVPPEILYHGTPQTAVAAIQREGLSAQQRQYVHMATTVERATSVGARHGKSVLLRVRAREAHEAGVVFFQADDEHYLTQSLPPEFIVFPADD